MASNRLIPSPRQCATLVSMRVPEAQGQSHPFSWRTAWTNHTACMLSMCIPSTVRVIQNHQRQLWEHFLYSFTQALAPCKYSSPLNLIHHHICVQAAISSDTQRRWNQGLPKRNSYVRYLKLTAWILQVKAVIDLCTLWLKESELCETHMTIKLYWLLDKPLHTNHRN